MNKNKNKNIRHIIKISSVIFTLSITCVYSEYTMQEQIQLAEHNAFTESLSIDRVNDHYKAIKSAEELRTKVRYAALGIGAIGVTWYAGSSIVDYFQQIPKKQKKKNEQSDTNVASNRTNTSHSEEQAKLENASDQQPQQRFKWIKGKIASIVTGTPGLIKNIGYAYLFGQIHGFIFNQLFSGIRVMRHMGNLSDCLFESHTIGWEIDKGTHFGSMALRIIEWCKNYFDFLENIDLDRELRVEKKQQLEQLYNFMVLFILASEKVLARMIYIAQEIPSNLENYRTIAKFFIKDAKFNINNISKIVITMRKMQNNEQHKEAIFILLNSMSLLFQTLEGFKIVETEARYADVTPRRTLTQLDISTKKVKTLYQSKKYQIDQSPSSDSEESEEIEQEALAKLVNNIF